MVAERKFRSQESFDAEGVTRDMLPGFLKKQGFTQVVDERKSFGNTQQQIVHARSPARDQMAMHVRLCWNRDPGNQRQKRYSAVQLLSTIKDDDWIGSLNAKVNRDRSKGVTHTLIVQREGSRLTDVVLIPVEELVGIWRAQRDLSAKLIKAGRLGGKNKNRAMNGSSPTLWLHDDKAPEIRALLLQWPGVVELTDSTTPSSLEIMSRRDNMAVRAEKAVSGGSAAVKSYESSLEYVARLAYNSQRWWRPTQADEVRESEATYRSEQGFGHEDWLFRSEWLLDGWRYGFVQGVNKSRDKLLRENRSFNLRLFTMPTPGDRRAVAEICDVECLDDASAAAAVAAYEELGWLDTMRAEVAAAGGRPQALDETGYAPHILNLRYRIENVHPLDADTSLPTDDPIQRIKRYQLCQVDGAMDSARSAWRGRAGTTTLTDTEKRYRVMQGGRIAHTPEHVRIQQALLKRLRASYPGLEPICEQDFVDVMLRTHEEIILFEVKSDLNPLSVVRQALGQVMEYAFHPRRTHDLPVRLVIVGRRDLEGDDFAYFEMIRQRFTLPVEYWSVPV